MREGPTTYTESIDAARAELAKAAEEGENILMPAESLANVPPMHKVTVERIQLSANPDDKDVYVQLGREDDPPEKKRYALTKDGLFKLSSCAGVQWDYANSGRIDRQDSGSYIAWRMVGAVQKLDGSWLPLQGSYDLDFDVIEEEIREQKTRACQNWRNLDTPVKKAAWIEQATKSELLKIRRHKVARVETGAMLRAIRGLLNIKGTYSFQEIKKPFVIARLVFQPDYADPIIKAQAVALAFKAMQGVYGIQAPNLIPQRQIGIGPVVELEQNDNGQYGPPPSPPNDSPPPSPPSQPRGQDSATDSQDVDFENSDKDGKIATINALIRQKGYDVGKLKQPLEKYSDAALLKFFRGLTEMPDQPADDIPY